MTRTLGEGARARLELTGLRFGATPVLGALQLDIQPGETVALVGPSGIGKTSLLRIIAGLERRFEGRRAVTQSLAYVFQEPTLLPWRRVLANVTIPARCDAACARAHLEAVGLLDHLQAFPGQLSLGQQRRLSLARAFAARPELLLMDEPFVSLDMDLAGDMIARFEALRADQGLTTLFVTHTLSEAERLADRILTLGGRPATIVDEKKL